MNSVYQTFFLKSLATLTWLLSRRGLTHIGSTALVFRPKKKEKKLSMILMKFDRQQSQFTFLGE